MLVTVKYIKCLMRLRWVYYYCVYRQHNYIVKWHERRAVPQQHLSFLSDLSRKIFLGTKYGF